MERIRIYTLLLSWKLPRLPFIKILTRWEYHSNGHEIRIRKWSSYGSAIRMNFRLVIQLQLRVISAINSRRSEIKFYGTLKLGKFQLTSRLEESFYFNFHDVIYQTISQQINRFVPSDWVNSWTVALHSNR